jgi:hypothetical protein
MPYLVKFDHIKYVYVDFPALPLGKSGRIDAAIDLVQIFARERGVPIDLQDH